MRWLLNNFAAVGPLLFDHIWLSLVPTSLGLALALPIGMGLHNRPGARRVAVVICSFIFTVPSLALFVTIPTLIGTQILDPINVAIALSLYSGALLVRTVLESLDSVPAEVRAASEAIGTSPLRMRLGVDLPLAIPVLTAGTRVVAVTNVSLVSVGAVIGVGGLGQLLTAGYQRSYPDQILAGIIAILVLAFILDRAIAITGALLTPWLRANRVPRRRPAPREVAHAG